MVDWAMTLGCGEATQRHLQQLGHAVAPACEARRFAVERLYHYRSSGEPAEEVECPVGIHKAYNYLGVVELDAILSSLEARYDELASVPCA